MPTLNVGIASSTDDVEDSASRQMYRSSSDLELGDDPRFNGNGQTIGQRTAEPFNGVAAAALLLPIEYLASGPLNDPVTFNAPADSDTNPDQIAKKTAAGTPGRHGRPLERQIVKNPSKD